MDLMIDTTGVEFQVSKPFAPRLDKEGNVRRDKMGGTNLPMHAVHLVAWMDDQNKESETLLVSVAAEEPPKLAQRQHVAIEGLQAIPWVADGKVRVAYRARSVVPAEAPKSNASAPSAKSAS